MLKYPRVESHQPIGKVGGLSLRAHDIHGCGALVRWLFDAQYSVAERARFPNPCSKFRRALGQKLGVKTGEWVKVSSARGELTVKAVVTPRMKPLKVNGQRSHDRVDAIQLGLQGLSTGPSVNHLTIDAVDPGAGTQETKACLVNVVKTSAPARGSIQNQEKENSMTRAGRQYADQVHADRHYKVHRLPRMPGCLQAVERTRWRRDAVAGLHGISKPGDSQRQDLTLITFHELPK